MYYCDCVEAWEDKGLPLRSKNDAYNDAGITYSQPVETKNGFCIHCGYAAVFSKTPIITQGITATSLEKAQRDAEIVSKRKAGVKIPELARDFKLTVSQIHRIIAEAKHV